MKTFILALATAVPTISLHQQEIAEHMVQALNITEPISSYVRSVYQRSAITKRHSVVEDFQREPANWKFWTNETNTVPGMKARNDIYKREALTLAHSAAHKALQEWGGNAQAITHIISVSCTGVMAPGIEFHLIKELGLSPSVQRLGINFMGCFGAFAGLKVAHALAEQNSNNRILLVCTELCSLHFQTDLNNDTLIANALFADGAAACVIGTTPQENEKPLWAIMRTQSQAIDDTIDQMSWEASDTGFIMHLTQHIPRHIQQSITHFTQTLLHDINPAQCAWALHPGGKAILRTIEEACQLKRVQTQPSWDVLNSYGNMSSPTFLFVLNEQRQRPQIFPWTIGIGFGPGLSVEGIMLENMYQ